MIMAVRHHFENFPALSGKTKTARLERMLQPLTKFGLFERGNTPPRLTFQRRRVNRNETSRTCSRNPYKNLLHDRLIRFIRPISS
jgi:hypothetical protein